MYAEEVRGKIKRVCARSTVASAGKPASTLNAVRGATLAAIEAKYREADSDIRQTFAVCNGVPILELLQSASTN